MAVTSATAIVWDVVAPSLVDVHRRFGRTFRPLLPSKQRKYVQLKIRYIQISVRPHGVTSQNL
jgi:hypothetical protein